jgi:hypothetical protein
MNPHASRQEPWLNAVRAGDFSALPSPFRYKQTSWLSHLINGYQVSDCMAWGLLRVWANERRDEAESLGQWRGTSLELWCCLFFERRRYRHGGEGDPTGPDLELLDRLCVTLREKLQRLSTDERKLILHFIAMARRPISIMN